MGRLRGIEPPNVGTTIRCVNHFATTAKILNSNKKNALRQSRTADTWSFNPLLYQLSYRGIIKFYIKKWRSRRESNPRSPAWQAGVITATPRDLTLILNVLFQMVTRTGFEPVLPPWKGGVLTTWPTGQ